MEELQELYRKLLALLEEQPKTPELASSVERLRESAFWCDNHMKNLNAKVARHVKGSTVHARG